MAFLWLNSLPTPTSRLKAEQEIYSVLFTYLRSSEGITQVEEFPLLVEFTTLGMAQECIAEECAQHIIDRLPNVKRATLTDFQEINKQSYLLKDYFPSTIYDLLNNPDKQQKTFWRLSFSRIGFDPLLTQALALVGDCGGEGCFNGMGNYYDVGDFILLHKVDGKWAVQDNMGYWIGENPPP